MGSNADGTFRGFSRARMLMHNECYCWPDRQQQAHKR